MNLGAILLRSPSVRTTNGSDEGDHDLSMRADVSCADCYFHKSGLCALVLDSPCPTFRLADRRGIVKPLQPQLVPRPLSAFAREPATA